MRIEELRVGNWYKWYADGKYYYYQIEAKDFISDNIINFEPIELTEEWLLKLGFEYNQEHICFGYKGFLIERLGDMFLDRRYGVVIKSVHHIQNFYNVITGEELTIKQNDQ